MDKVHTLGRVGIIAALILASIGIGVLIFLITRTVTDKPYEGSTMVRITQGANI